ncbi:MAG: hypothetical protein QOI65_1236 [Thermoleophilaceae bacterium]|nr:hypothetical protein [Thermoleophilaceae bacterium]
MNVRNPRFPLFDSVRGLAALSVVTCHIALTLNGFANPHVGRYLIQLNIGVAVFFMMSGFLLYRPFVAARFAGVRMPATGAYGIRRFFRIVPGYWVALPLIAIWLELTAVLNNPPPYFGFAQVYDRSTLFNGYGVAWTLCVEVPFYLLLPVWAFAMRRLPGRSRRALVLSEVVGLGLLCVGALVWNTTQSQHGAGPVPITTAVSSFPAFVDQFAIGMMLAMASVALGGREPRAIRVVHRASWLCWLVAIGAWVVLCNIGSVGTGSGEVVRHELRGLVAAAVLLPAVFGDDRGGVVRRLLADRRVQWVGLISYSLYLWHAAIVVKAGRAGWADRLGWLGFTIGALAASLAVGAIAFYAWERPSLRLGRRIAWRADGGRR